MPHQNEAVAGGRCQAPPDTASASTAAPSAMVPACTAVSVSAGSAWRPARRRVRQTMRARSTAAATISASPQPSPAELAEACALSDSSAAPASEIAAAANTRGAGRSPSSHHSASGVKATHRLIRKAALLALVSETPKVSQTKIASR